MQNAGEKTGCQTDATEDFQQEKRRIEQSIFPKAEVGRYREGNKTVRGTVSRDLLPHYFHDSNLFGPLIHMVSISWINLHVQTILQCNRKGISEISALA